MPICIDCGSFYSDTLVACPTCGTENLIAQPAAAAARPTCPHTGQLLKLSDLETNPTQQDPALLEKLSFPARPSAPEINPVLTILGVLLMFGALFGLIRVQTGSGPLIFAFCMAFAVIAFLKARVNSKQSAAYLELVKKWRAAKARWDLLYYCPECDSVFLPGESASAPADRMAEYLPEDR